MNVVRARVIRTSSADGLAHTRKRIGDMLEVDLDRISRAVPLVSPTGVAHVKDCIMGLQSNGRWGLVPLELIAVLVPHGLTNDPL